MWDSFPNFGQIHSRIPFGLHRPIYTRRRRHNTVQRKSDLIYYWLVRRFLRFHNSNISGNHRGAEHNELRGSRVRRPCRGPRGDHTPRKQKGEDLKYKSYFRQKEEGYWICWELDAKYFRSTTGRRSTSGSRSAFTGLPCSYSSSGISSDHSLNRPISPLKKFDPRKSNFRIQE